MERIAFSPDWTDPDPTDPDLTRAFGMVAEAENRILRVVFVDRAGERVVVTVHFDRNAARRRMGTRP